MKFAPALQVPASKVDFELGRLDTYTDSWPHPNNGHCSRLNMARAGFFYLRRKDMVECFCCGIKLKSWDPEEDKPWAKHYESCLFGSKAKRESELTISELIDVFANKAINKIDSKFNNILSIDR